MQVNPVSNSNPNFQAKFTMDSRGLLREFYQHKEMTDSAKHYLGEFCKIGKDQEVEFVNYIGNYNNSGKDRVKLFNKTTGKRLYTFLAKGDDFWGEILKGLSENKGFFKPDRIWQELTGQKVVTWTKK